MHKSTLSPTSEWFLRMFFLLIALVGIYLALHYLTPTLRNSREQVVYLNTNEISKINELLNSEQTDTSDQTKTADITSLKDKIYAYINLRYTIRDHSKSKLKEDLRHFKTTTELRAILPDYPLRIQSFFWLSDNWMYTEIIFWAIFGVIANLLYIVSEAVRPGGPGFDSREIYSHWAKLTYTPFSVLIIYLSINLFSQQSFNNSSFSAWQIVMAFILGFFSGRTIELLNRIKDLILPLNNEMLNPANLASRTYVVQGKINIANSTTENDFSLAAIKLLSQTDAALNTAQNALKDGSFRFENLPAGNYQLVAEMKQHEQLLLASISFKLDGQNPEPFVELPLEPFNFD